MTPQPSPFSDAGNAVFPAPDARLETVRPCDEAELRGILREAHAQNVPVTVVAALTGLTGGAVPLESGLRLDMTALTALPDHAGFRRITPFLLLSDKDPSHGLVAPGVSLQTLNDALDTLDLWYPPHPGEWRATIGGNVATNASGPRTFAYGSTRQYVESLRVLLPDGDALELKRGRERASGRRFSLRTESGRVLEGTIPDYTMPPVKNAAGLFAQAHMDLIDLFIGSEGILGVITEVGLRFLPRREITSRILFFTTASEAIAFVDAMRPLKVQPDREDPVPSATADGVVALEFFDSGALRLAREAGQRVPEHAVTAVEFEFFADDPETETRAFLIADRLNCAGSIPAGETIAFRYAVPRRVAELLKERGQPKFGTDFAVPVSSFRELFDFYEVMDAEFGQQPDRVRTAKWGHVGDCHLHCNFLCESAEDQRRARAIYLKLVRKAVSLGGTVSAEHGVGKKTLADEQGIVRPYLWYMLGDDYRQIADVKRVFDPKGMLNRGNMGIGKDLGLRT